MRTLAVLGKKHRVYIQALFAGPNNKEMARILARNGLIAWAGTVAHDTRVDWISCVFVRARVRGSAVTGRNDGGARTESEAPFRVDITATIRIQLL